MYTSTFLILCSIVLTNGDLKVNINGATEIDAVDDAHKKPDTCTPEYAAIQHHTMCVENSPLAVRSGVTAQDEQLIVDLHNTLRAGVTPKPTDMLYMVWDNKMAAIAQKWAKQCVVGHDAGASRAVPGYGIHIGQSVAGGFKDWEKAIMGWYNEVYQFNYTYGEKPKNFLKVGHYIQLVHNATTRLGCGFSECQQNGQSRNYYVCNYAKGMSRRTDFPYTAGESCVACPDNCKNELCDCRGKLCLNGGKLNVSTCECSCKDVYKGESCDTLECPAVDTWYCGSEKVPPTHCKKYSNTKYACPYMCGLCEKYPDGTYGPVRSPNVLSKKVQPVGPKFISAHGCEFFGERPNEGKCKNFGQKGLDRGLCKSEGGNVYACGDCSSPVVRTRHCPVMCGTCDAPCKGKRCYNGGRLDTASCQCQCRGGFSGLICKKPPCKGKLCKNGGKLNISTCQCACPIAFTGNKCMKPKCGSRPCKNGGKMDYNTCNCKCNGRFTGKYCGRAPCGGRKCSNGGIMNYGTCVCRCPRKFTGRLCKNVRCGKKECANGGRMRLSTCTCKCPRNYEGKYCRKFVCPTRDSSRCPKPPVADCTVKKTRDHCPFLCQRCRKPSG